MYINVHVAHGRKAVGAFCTLFFILLFCDLKVAQFTVRLKLRFQLLLQNSNIVDPIRTKMFACNMGSAHCYNQKNRRGKNGKCLVLQNRGRGLEMCNSPCW